MNPSPEIPPVPVVPASSPVAAPVASAPAAVAPRSSWKKKVLVVSAIVLGSAGIAAAGTAFWVKHNFYASALNPVALTQTEQASLNGKLQILGQQSTAAAVPAVDPEVAKRTLTISEREINAFLSEQGFGEQVKVEFTHGGASATVLVPVDKDAPILAGTTLRFRFAFGARMDNEKHFAFSLNDISVGGVPVPNAWLGNLKGLNLLADSPLHDDPAVKGFLAGIRDFKIEGGTMRIVLNE